MSPTILCDEFQNTYTDDEFKLLPKWKQHYITRNKLFIINIKYIGVHGTQNIKTFSLKEKFIINSNGKLEKKKKMILSIITLFKLDNPELELKELNTFLLSSLSFKLLFMVKKKDI